MAYPRAHLIDEDNPGFYHLISECVRRAFLCGKDKFSGQDYSHRQRWIEERLIELTHYFAIDVYAYAVMSNHYHVIVHTDPDRIRAWSADEVARRWILAMHNPDKSHLKPDQLALRIRDVVEAGPERIEVLRQRLKSVSWYMARINEVLARRSNREDGCRGRFWEGRFHSEVLLKERDVLRAMVYADLNPVRAGIADELEETVCNGTRRRIEQAKVEPESLDRVVQAFSGGGSTFADAPPIMLTAREYIELVRWTGVNVVYPDKATLAPQPAGNYFERLGIRTDSWLGEVNEFNKRRRARGPSDLIKSYMKRLRDRVDELASGPSSAGPDPDAPPV